MSHPPAPLRLVSYNICKCVGLDMRRRPERILQVLEGTGAQIAVLQEADKRMAPRPAALPPFRLTETGWHIADLGGGGSLGWHGNAVIWRGDGLRVRERAHIDLPGLEPRGAVRVEFDTGHGPLRVIGAHLGLLPRHRRAQVLHLAAVTDALEPMPTVWAGDFNDWSTQAMLDGGAPNMRFLRRLASFPSPSPMGALDRIALSGGIIAGGHGVYAESPAQIASDHLPVWADLIMPQSD